MDNYYWSDLGFDRVGDSCVADIGLCDRRFTEAACLAGVPPFVRELQFQSEHSPLFRRIEESSSVTFISNELSALLESLSEVCDRKFVHRCLFKASKAARKGFVDGSHPYVATLPAVQSPELYDLTHLVRLTRVGNWAVGVMTRFAPLVINGEVTKLPGDLAQFLRSSWARDMLEAAGPDYFVSRAKSKYFKFGCDLYRVEDELRGYFQSRVVHCALEYLKEEADKVKAIPIPNDVLETYGEEKEEDASNKEPIPDTEERSVAESFVLEDSSLFESFCSAVSELRSQTNRRTYQGHLALFADRQSESEGQSAAIIEADGRRPTVRMDSFFPILAVTARSQMSRASDELSPYWTVALPSIVELNKRNARDGLKPLPETREEHAWWVGRWLYGDDKDRFYELLCPIESERLRIQELVRHHE